MINYSNRILTLFHLYCRSKYKLPTMPIANVVKLASFVMLTFLNIIKPFCVYYILFMIGLLFSMGYSISMSWHNKDVVMCLKK